MNELADGTCPRCNGFMYTNKDVYGEYAECLQCGFMEDGNAQVTIDSRTTEEIA